MYEPKEEPKMRSKSLFFVLVTVLLSLLAAGCGPSPTPEVVERIVIQTEVVEKTVKETTVVEVVVTPTAEPKPEVATTIRVDSLSESGGKNFVDMVVSPFAKEIGVEINVELGTYGSQDEWLAQVRAAPGEHCIALYVSDFGLYNGVNQELLLPFRLENIPNYSNLADKWENRVIVPGDENAYVATLDIGMYTFVYAKDKISERPTSYAPLFDPKYADRIALRDYGLYRIFQTAAYLGLDPNNLSDADVDQVFAAMAEQQELARAYWQSSAQLDGLLANREVYMADYWFDTITKPGEDGTNKLGQLDIGWWFPEEGGPIWSGGPVIAAGCPESERYTAELLINYLLQKDVYLNYAKANGYIPTLDTSLYDSAAFFSQNPSFIAYRDAILNTGILLDVANVLTHQDAWNERYEEMKLGN